MPSVRLNTSNSTGLGQPISTKTGCCASVTIVTASKDELEKLSAAITASSVEFQFYVRSASFVKLYSVDMSHSNHHIERFINLTRVICRQKDIFNEPEIRQKIISFIISQMHISERGDGFLINLRIYLEDIVPSVKITADTLKNFTSPVRKEEEDASKLTRYMKELNLNNQLDQVSYSFTKSNVVLNITWSFKESREVAQKLNDIVFSDFTNNMTSYTDKLWTFTVVEYECKSRPIFFNRGLNYYSFQCCRLLLECQVKFYITLSKVIFTDGDHHLMMMRQYVQLFQSSHTVMI